MPLYYFQIFNDVITLDDEGAELSDEEAARAHAGKAARALASETVLLGHLSGSHRIDIVDSERKPVGSVHFDEAIVIK